MALTSILPSDPSALKAWSAKVAVDAAKEVFWTRHVGPEGSNAMVVRKDDLEKGAGDEITTTLVAKLRGRPILEGEKAEGNSMKLEKATHKMKINQYRHSINSGRPMDQQRVNFSLAEQSRMKIKDYIKELTEEITAAAAAGMRGNGDEFQHLPSDWNGNSNTLRAPDAGHYMVLGAAGTLAGLTAADKLSIATINRLVVKSKKMNGSAADAKAVRMSETSVGGRSGYCFLTSPEGLQDIRDDVGAAGWVAAQQALTQAVGKNSELFKGGAGWMNGVCIEETPTFARQAAGAGGAVPAHRSLFCGANALAWANGAKGHRFGARVELTEHDADLGNEKIVAFSIIFGADKTQYDGVDYGIISVDHAVTAAA